ncbi:hypothetical protein [Trichormus sp. NMC-1]|uniref:hypothetical protein n=1 Tax=Trichormus sp. NMC-1 TaxID=1853259 RepID=UPI0008DC162C|nr:hypothetical protein [Trichormus sp. NMC-1]
MTIYGLRDNWYGDLRAFLSNDSTTVQLFRSDVVSADGPSSPFTDIGRQLNGDYTFATTGANWYTASSPVPSNITYQSWQPLSAFNGSSLNGTWTLNVQDRWYDPIRSPGSFTGFSINATPEATPVPFEFSHQASLVLLGGAWLVRRGLKKKSADKMLAKSLNS